MIDGAGIWAESGLSIGSGKLALMKSTFICALAAMAVVVTVSAEEFPLIFRTIPAQDVLTFPNGAGSAALMKPERPATLRQEPKAISRHPLYGECRDASTGGTFIFRLDESRGDGRGYDRLIVDINENGDLTDDGVAKRVELSSDQRGASLERLLFGPIQLPPDRAVAGGRPVYFIQVYVFNRQSSSMIGRRPNALFAQLMLKAGWYLDTTVKVDGLKQKVGVIDADSNVRLGDVAQTQTRTNGGVKSWYFSSGDYLLVDANRSGRFESDVFLGEVRPFGPILYLGSKAYQVALTPGCKSLRVEPWPGPLAEVTVQPRGEQVHSVTLAWERPNGQWQRIQPALVNGKVMVPPGNYRLYDCSLRGRRALGDQVMLFGTQRIPQPPLSVAVGKVNTLDCGGPLQIKVTATKAGTEGRGVLGGYFGGGASGTDSMLRIAATVTGAGGEAYSTFLTGERPNTRPPKPSFSIVQVGGRTVAMGNLEYG
jgi:hypothetical protein